jgi:hypothetical protein
MIRLLPVAILIAANTATATNLECNQIIGPYEGYKEWLSINLDDKTVDSRTSASMGDLEVSRIISTDEKFIIAERIATNEMVWVTRINRYSLKMEHYWKGHWPEGVWITYMCKKVDKMPDPPKRKL